MNKKVNVIDLYFDESGFTGNNLNDPKQRIFSYLSLNTSENYAKEIIQELKIKHNIKQNELKGSKLIRRENGKNFLIDLIYIFKDNMIVSISNKKFSLSAKFFEYIFEPLISDKSSLFYDLNFHLFISNILYVHYICKDKGANQLLIDFQNLVRDGNGSGFSESLKLQSVSAPIIQDLIDFCVFNETNIKERLKDEFSDVWTLDLTRSALFSLLSKWGEKKIPLRAFCDESKPLLANQDIFDIMLNREDIFYYTMGDKNFPLTFNLKEPLILLNSEQSSAIQVADNICSAVCYAFDSSKDDEVFKNKVKSLINESNCYACIQLDYDYLDLKNPKVFRNAMILQELSSRSRNNTPLLPYIEQVINEINIMLNISK